MADTDGTDLSIHFYKRRVVYVEIVTTKEDQ